MKYNKESILKALEYVLGILKSDITPKNNYGICVLVGEYCQIRNDELWILKTLEPEFKKQPGYLSYYYFSSTDTYSKTNNYGVFHFKTREERIKFLEEAIEKINNNEILI